MPQVPGSAEVALLTEEVTYAVTARLCMSLSLRVTLCGCGLTGFHFGPEMSTGSNFAV